MERVLDGLEPLVHPQMAPPPFIVPLESDELLSMNSELAMSTVTPKRSTRAAPPPPLVEFRPSLPSKRTPSMVPVVQNEMRGVDFLGTAAARGADRPPGRRLALGSDVDPPRGDSSGPLGCHR